MTCIIEERTVTGRGGTSGPTPAVILIDSGSWPDRLSHSRASCSLSPREPVLKLIEIESQRRGVDQATARHLPQMAPSINGELGLESESNEMKNWKTLDRTSGGIFCIILLR